MYTSRPHVHPVGPWTTHGMYAVDRSMTSAREQQSWRRGRKNSTAQRAVEFLGGGTPAGYHHATSHTDRQTDGRSERNERTRERENERTKGNQRRRRRPGPPRGERERHQVNSGIPNRPRSRLQPPPPRPTSTETTIGHPTTPQSPHTTVHSRRMNRSPSNVLQPNSRRFLRLRPRHRVNTPNYVPFNREGMYPGQKLRETKRCVARWPRFSPFHACQPEPGNRQPDGRSLLRRPRSHIAPPLHSFDDSSLRLNEP